MDVKNIKRFIECYCGYIGAKNVSVLFLMELCKYVHESNSEDSKIEKHVTISKRERDEIAKELGVSDRIIKKQIINCIDNHLLFKTKYRYYFKVNQCLIPKFKWDNIEELRAEFDFTKNIATINVVIQ